MHAREREDRADARVFEGGAQELAFDRRAIGAVVAAAALVPLEVDGPVLAAAVGVAGRQDAARTHVDLVLAGFSGDVEALVDEREGVTGLDSAREVHVPGEDAGEVVGELGTLAEGFDRLVEAGADQPGQARLAALEAGLVAGGSPAALGPLEAVALERGALVAEGEYAAVRRLFDAEAVVGVRVTEVEDRGHFASDQVDRRRPHRERGERARKGSAAADATFANDPRLGRRLGHLLGRRRQRRREGTGGGDGGGRLRLEGARGRGHAARGDEARQHRTGKKQRAGQVRTQHPLDLGDRRASPGVQRHRFSCRNLRGVKMAHRHAEARVK
jgi:hypothetical protein